MNSHSSRRSRLPRRLLFVVAVLAALTGIAVAPSWASTRIVYAALGDSYSAGVGAPPYDPASGSCTRSPRSAAALWAASHPGTSLTFVACRGATTTDVLNKQLGALSGATTQVTISFGGNDAGFTPVLTTCVTGTDAACLIAVQQAEGYMTTVLLGTLDKTYAAIRARAPHARLIVLGYPRLFELTSSCFQSGMSLYKRGLVNHAADILNQVIHMRAATASATFVDVRPVFAGHGVCSSSPWIWGITSPTPFHPNETGYSAGYLPALRQVAG